MARARKQLACPKCDACGYVRVSTVYMRPDGSTAAELLDSFETDLRLGVFHGFACNILTSNKWRKRHRSPILCHCSGPPAGPREAVVKWMLQHNFFKPCPACTKGKTTIDRIVEAALMGGDE